MPKVAEVKLRYATSPVWFSQGDSLELAEGDYVLVQTERGKEIGLVEAPDKEVTDEEVAGLSSPLKPVIRLITEEDYDYIDQLDKLGKDAMPIFRESIKKYDLDMKPVAVDYLFDKDKAVFYFAAEERVDFRALVRELASRLHISVDMRQIGVRDETRIVGGIAHCGEEYCCVRFNGEFQPVAIRMAKEQNLPLNPAKISGACGRLMCCLRYEYEAYKDFNSRAPKRGAKIDTPLGVAKVMDLNTPRETVDLRLEDDDKTFTVPLSCMDCEKGEDGKCKRPTSISAEALERVVSGSSSLVISTLDRFDGTLTDEVADKSKRRAHRVSQQADEAEQPKTEHRKRRRRSRSGGSSDANQDSGTTEAASKEAGPGSTQAQDQKASRPRPGQHSSGVKTAKNGGKGQGQGQGQGGKAQNGQEGQDGQPKSSSHRRRRRSSGKGKGNGAGNGGQTQAQGQAQVQGGQRQNGQGKPGQGKPQNGGQGNQGARGGQGGPSKGGQAQVQGGKPSQGNGSGNGSTGGRKPRRRTAERQKQSVRNETGENNG